MTTETNLDRYLDDAFAQFPRTPENTDLKDEIRGNLASRVAELVAEGAKPDAAAATAIKELGDIRKLVTSVDPDPATTNKTATAARLMQLNRVKVSAGYVVRTVLLALLLAAAVAIVTTGSILGAMGIAPAWIVSALPIESILAGAFLGLIVGDALAHETSQHVAMPGRRALGFAAAAFAGLTGLGLVASWLANPLVWLLIVGCVLALAAIMAFVALGVTQTNRSKPWVKELNAVYAIDDRFSQDPAAAARFGLYTVVIWIVAIAAFIVLSITVGFVWSWLALLAGIVVFFLVLARMLFPAKNDRTSIK
ncbi:MAG TPA: permease prefix domain 1-containing protein [Galbitalea sp.]|jgi:hypothetical protein|nr:permease prefix domain 1-containing protein [Galbitalea sp.]